MAIFLRKENGAGKHDFEKIIFINFLVICKLNLIGKLLAIKNKINVNDKTEWIIQSNQMRSG